MKLAILGSRGIPAAHGGFETFAERLALYLTARGWQVEVYCQDETGKGLPAWRGIVLQQIKTPFTGAWGSVFFDLLSTVRAARGGGLVLTLGYNTGILACIYRLCGQRNVFNMDGLEWRRPKWSRIARAWLYLNERCACLLGNQLVADHPEIAAHLETRVSREKITVIPYGSDQVHSADEGILQRFGLMRDGYALVIARPVPENSLLEIVTAFCQTHRSIKLVVLGRYEAEHAYHAKVVAAAGGQVVFAGAIYDQPTLDALRLYSMFCIHGHQVGGTNPSLVEAIGTGCPVLAHDNRFNRWVAGAEALYFKTPAECAALITQLIADRALRSRMEAASRRRHAAVFTWDQVLADYESFLLSAMTAGASNRPLYQQAERYLLGPFVEERDAAQDIALSPHGAE